MQTLEHYCQEQFNISAAKGHLLTPFRHTFSHFHLHIHPVYLEVVSLPLQVQETQAANWWHTDTQLQFALPAPIKRLLTQMQALV
jgi:A/G-specific adenine glycosylase